MKVVVSLILVAASIVLAWTALHVFVWVVTSD